MKSWKGIKTLDAARKAFDLGEQIEIPQAKRVLRALNKEDTLQLFEHAASKIAENIQDRFVAELYIFNVLQLISQTSNKDQTSIAFLRSFFEQGLRPADFLTFCNICLTGDICENEDDIYLFRIAVALVTEVGLAVARSAHTSTEPDPRSASRQEIYEYKELQSLSSHYKTYLMSLTNTNDKTIRYLLFYYFSHEAALSRDGLAISKVIDRFGINILEQTFILLMHEECETIAYRYLEPNIAFCMYGDILSQQTVNETLRSAMLKEPEKFGMYIYQQSRFVDKHAAAHPDMVDNYCKHLATLMAIAASLKHKFLITQLAVCMQAFASNSHLKKCLFELSSNAKYSRDIQRMFIRLSKQPGALEGIPLYLKSRNTKRGRKPTFGSAEDIMIQEQAIFLVGKVNMLELNENTQELELQAV